MLYSLYSSLSSISQTFKELILYLFKTFQERLSKEFELIVLATPFSFGSTEPKEAIDLDITTSDFFSTFSEGSEIS